MSKTQREISFFHLLLPILFLLVLIIYGLILRPQFFQQPAFPLEVLFIFAATFAIGELFWLGFKWDDILNTIVRKIASAMPAFLVLLSIGLIIGSWMVCGTIPMLVYYGLKFINPNLIYLLAFIVPALFSILTGTSWGSAGAVGIVIMGISGAMEAHLGITAGAIVGGAYFGDKMSPLSDTTNLAAIAADVNLFDHIRSMVNTTAPSSLIALSIYFILGYIYPPNQGNTDSTQIEPFMNALETMFVFSPFLLIPPIIVLFCSVRKKPAIPTIVVSMLSASMLALLFQRFTLADILQSLYKGFNADMAHWIGPVPERVEILLNRGGLYALNDAVIVAFMVFIFIGALDHINAMPIVVKRVFSFVRTRPLTILSSLGAAAVTNALTSNQYATSFIVGDSFKSRYDALGISRKVLSRSIEDTGTMLESIVPWHPSAVFMVLTLGVPFADYWHWQLLSVINIMVAVLFAVTGIGCFYNEKNNK